MSVIRTGSLAVDLAARRVTVNGMLVDIGGFHQTQREWRYLACVAQRVGEFVSYKKLAAEVLDWPDVGRYELRNLRTIRRRLFDRLGEPCKPLIRVSHGHGVTLENIPVIDQQMPTPGQRDMNPAPCRWCGHSERAHSNNVDCGVCSNPPINHTYEIGELTRVDQLLRENARLKHEVERLKSLTGME